MNECDSKFSITYFRVDEEASKLKTLIRIYHRCNGVGLKQGKGIEKVFIYYYGLEFKDLWRDLNLTYKDSYVLVDEWISE